MSKDGKFSLGQGDLVGTPPANGDPQTIVSTIQPTEVDPGASKTLETPAQPTNTDGNGQGAGTVPNNSETPPEVSASPVPEPTSPVTEPTSPVPEPTSPVNSPEQSNEVVLAAPFSNDAMLVNNNEPLSGNCQISNVSDATGGVAFSGTPFACERLIPARSAPSTTPATAAAAVFGVLFAGVAALLIFFLLRSRKRRDHEHDTTIDHSYALKSHDMGNGRADDGQVGALQSQLSAERRRVNDLQAALLAQSSSPSGWTSAAAKDDRDVKRSFHQIFGEIKDLAGNYYRSQHVPGAHEISTELGNILGECVDGWDAMLGDTRGRMLLVRVACGEILRRAWDDGEFLGKRVGRGFRVVEKEVTKHRTIQQSHLWRVQTIGPLISTVDPKTRSEAISAIVTRIASLLVPFAPQSPGPNPAHYIESIVSHTSLLYFDLATQNAFYSLQPYISLSRPGAAEESAVFEVASCDDVEQRFESGRDNQGREWSQAEGSRIRGFVFPAVVKYGDGRGGGWEAPMIVVFKAQVFV